VTGEHRIFGIPLCVVVAVIIVFLIAGDIIVFHSGPSVIPVVPKSFNHIAADLRDETDKLHSSAARENRIEDLDEVHIDVRLSIIPRGSVPEDSQKVQALAAMSYGDCTFLQKELADTCYIESSSLNATPGVPATSFARYVIKFRIEPVAQ